VQTPAPATIEAPASLLPGGESPVPAAGGEPAGAPGLGGLSSLAGLLGGGGQTPSFEDILKLFNPQDLMKLIAPNASR
jgi:hypothetical protein